MRVSITTGTRRSGSDDPQFRIVEIGPIKIWFSYDTPVAFRIGNGETVVRSNAWGPTTGRHLNAIDGGDRESRIPGDEFVRQLELRVGRFFYPRDLDADCPAGVVSDWLRDRGLDKAADAVAKEIR